ncbi:MAG: hypothetical protein HY823_06715 [Acidobacteria bacterium]|nr:hypothetical protein [Acidobacteriota bacterium]
MRRALAIALLACVPFAFGAKPCQWCADHHKSCGACAQTHKNCSTCHNHHNSCKDGCYPKK